MYMYYGYGKFQLQERQDVSSATNEKIVNKNYVIGEPAPSEMMSGK